MKRKLVVSVLLSVLMFSCGKKENIEQQIPSSLNISALKDDKLIESFAVATFENGILHISTPAYSGIDLYIEKLEKGTFLCGRNQLNEATIQDGSTAATSNYDESTKGKVIISDINLKDSTISGSFEYEGLNYRATKRIKVSKGQFTKVKIISNINAHTNRLSYNLSGQKSIFRELSGNYNVSRNTFVFSGIRYIGNELLALEVPASSLSVRSYDIPQNVYVSYESSANKQIRAVKINKGIFNITNIDTMQKILKASFTLDLIDIRGNSLEIQEGELDIKYRENK
jgi:Family of unknown function (DUF6252)